MFRRRETREYREHAGKEGEGLHQQCGSHWRELIKGNVKEYAKGAERVQHGQESTGKYQTTRGPTGSLSVHKLGYINLLNTPSAKVAW